MNHIDNVFIFSKSWDDHFHHLERWIFDTIKSERFKLKLVKYVFAARSVKYLGYIGSRKYS